MGKSRSKRNSRPLENKNTKNGGDLSSDDEPISNIRASSRAKPARSDAGNTNSRRVSSRKRARTDSEKSEKSDKSETPAEEEEEEEEEVVVNTKKRNATRAMPSKVKNQKKAAKQQSEDDEQDTGEKATEDDEQGAEEEVDDEYEVDYIVAHKFDHGRRKYLVRWKGYGSEDDSWQTERSLSCSRLIKDYIQRNPDAKLPRGRKNKKRKKKQNIRERVPKIDEMDDYDEKKFDKNRDWEVERVLDVHFNKDKSRDFLIRWKGYSSKCDSWEPEQNLSCEGLIERFMHKYNERSNVSEKSLRVVRQPTQRFTLMTQSKDRRLSRRLDGRQRVEYYDSEL